MTVFAALVCSTGLLWGQATLKGKVVSASTDEPLIGASVLLAGTNKGTVTDVDGMFSLKDVPSGAQTLEISYLGYQTRTIQIDVPSSGMIDLGTIELEEGGVGLKEVVVTGVMDIVRDRRTPVAVSTITSQEIQLKSVGNVEFPEVMKNTPSVYVSHQTGFGDSRMYLRGFDQVNTAFLLNGQPINGMEDGKMYWSNWAGMSDIATLVQVQRGLGSSKLAISSVGGTVNIVTKTIENKKGGFVRFMLGNDNYIKGTVAYNTTVNGPMALGEADKTTSSASAISPPPITRSTSSSPAHRNITVSAGLKRNPPSSKIRATTNTGDMI